MNLERESNEHLILGRKHRYFGTEWTRLSSSILQIAISMSRALIQYSIVEIQCALKLADYRFSIQCRAIHRDEIDLSNSS
jgi:hypothetical protein